MSQQLEIITGVYDRCSWQSPNSSFAYHFLQDGTAIGGETEEGELLHGIPYEFYGKWKSNERGRTFMFRELKQKEPVSREGIIAYLTKYTELGYGTCAKIADEYGQDAIGTLRTQPNEVSKRLDQIYGASRFRTKDRLWEAAHELTKIAKMESARLALTDLLMGRGFQRKLVDLAIEKWGLLAAARIRRDPFCMLVVGFPSAGFARCNKLYEDLGLPLGRLKRQMICMWYAIQNDTSGHTWYPSGLVADMLAEKVSGCELQPKKAMKLGFRANWLAKRRDADGALWLSTKERADAERSIADDVKRLLWHDPDDDDDVGEVTT